MNEIEKTMFLERSGKKDGNYNYKEIHKQKLIELRRQEDAIVTLARPSNIARARKLGYKAKRGVFIARVRVRKGSGSHLRPRMGRKPRRMAVNKLTRKISIQGIAEQKAARKYSNAEVINSYWIAEDGKHEFYEVILIDTAAPEIVSDKQLGMIMSKRRAFRGLTSSQRKTRGLGDKGKGTEKARPSRRANNRKSK